jgi:hypothetical protein
VQSYIDVSLSIADLPVEISNAPKSWRKILGLTMYERTFEKGDILRAGNGRRMLRRGCGRCLGRGVGLMVWLQGVCIDP